MKTKNKWLKPLVNKAAMVIAENAIQILERFLLKEVKHIELPTLTKAVEDAMDSLTCVVRIFLDENPNNKEQLLQMVKRDGLVHADNLTELGGDFVLAKLYKTNPVLAKSLERMARAAIDEKELSDTHDGDLTVPVYNRVDQNRLKP